MTLSQRRTRHRFPNAGSLGWPAVPLALWLILVACGGGDDGDGDGGDGKVPDAIADLASDSGNAAVTIGDATFEFSLAGTQTIDGTTYVGRCEVLFGMIVGSGFAADGRDITPRAVLRTPGPGR